MGAIERMVLRYEWQRRIKRNIECTVMPELELGMDRNLWGLTLWIWNYVLQMGIKNLSLQKTQDGRVEELKAI